MKGETKTETMSLDEINRALDLARERDPSIEPEPGYSDGFQSQLQPSAGDHATNLSILTAAAFIRGTRQGRRSVSRLSYTKMSSSWLANIDVSGKASLFTNSSRGERAKLSRPRRSADKDKIVTRKPELSKCD